MALAPDRADIWVMLGNNLSALGRFREAIECHKRALALDPDHADASRGMVAAGERIENQQELERLREAVEDDSLDVHQRISAGFALGTLLDKAGSYEEAFERFATANRLVRAESLNEGKGFDIAELRARVDWLIETFSPDLFERTRCWGNPSEIPVFIVGMPRSGTTLAEQIVASHGQAFGMGERKDIGRITVLLKADRQGLYAPEWDPALVRQHADDDLARLTAAAGGALRVADKMPDNVLWLGLIALLYPRSRVVVCRRDLRDVGLSCYFQAFNAGLSWSNDLGDCAARALEIERLLRHWRAVLPLPMLELRYESLVADLEGETRRLLDFLGLPWDPSCLAFYQTERQIMTASLWQVRQPLYTSSVGRWRHYEKWLAPLLDGLQGGAEAV
ncbi:MAG: sulfotransferase [Acetobacteraceae bacterium]|nr:sulfotransferase [Acetobacteraceae bacterium]